MNNLNNYLNEDKVKGGLGDNRPDSDFDKTELKKGIEIEMEHTNDKDLAKEIAKDHLTEDPEYYIKLVDIENDEDDTIEVDIVLDIEDEPTEVNERRIRQTKKMLNSSKVVRETTEELFGKEGSQRALVDKIFRLFKKEVRAKASELGVPVGQVRTWKITLRDYDNPKEGTNLKGQKQ